MKVLDRLMLMIDLSATEKSYFSKDLSDNDEEPDLQKVLISKACICQMIKMKINGLEIERRMNFNHQ